MSEMMDRIRDEMAANPEDTMLQTIGEHLTAYLTAHPETRIREGATIRGAMNAMMEKARKKAVGGMAALCFTSGMETVYAHMGITWDKEECMRVQFSLYDKAAPLPEAVRPDPKAHADEFDLDAILEGI